jgi:glyoxylase-like metal-dependent hydrolase (beta-lactamase superfamily II)
MMTSDGVGRDAGGSIHDSAHLRWKCLVRRRASATPDAPAGKDDLKWVANTVTLIQGELTSVLIDTFLGETQTDELADWIAKSGKGLSTVYITHAHPDHFFGLKRLLDRFPQARAIASHQVVQAMERALAPESVAPWRPRFPGISGELVPAEPLDGEAIDLEGRKILTIDIGHTDTDHTTCIHVPSLGLVVAGDAVYNDTHVYLVESDHPGRIAWLAALDKIEALNPQAVVCGHGPVSPDRSPRHIAATRRYIEDYMRSDMETLTARELYDRMLTLYPNRVNPGSLRGSARAAKARTD